MIHVLITRRIAEGMLSTYEQLARKAMHRTYIAHGFISGETFFDSEDPHNRYILCKWRSTQDWRQWAISEERMQLVSQIAPILLEPEHVVILKN